MENVNRPPIIESQQIKTCYGRDGVVPAGKEPGRDVTVSTFADISRDVEGCANFAPDGNVCRLDQSRCYRTISPRHQLIPDTLLHIENTPNPSQTTLANALGRSKTEAGRVINHLKDQGAVAETGNIVSAQGGRGRPSRRLAVTGVLPRIPYKTPQRSQSDYRQK
jgi:hypothetical protein